LRVHPSIEEAAAHLKERGFTIYAANLSKRAVDYRQVDYVRPAVVLLGAEKWGVSRRAAELADANVIIPMMGMVQSLNVSVAAAVILFEAQRQRLEAGLYDRPRLDPETYRRTLFEWGYPRRAEVLRRRGLPYPELDEEGQIVSL